MALLVGDTRTLPSHVASSTYQVFHHLATDESTRNKVALTHDNTRLSYSELELLVDSLQRWLLKNVQEIRNKCERQTEIENTPLNASPSVRRVSREDLRSTEGIYPDARKGAKGETKPHNATDIPLSSEQSSQTSSSKKQVLIGLCLHRSPKLVALILAIWKLGWAYVPLDPDVPALRTLYVLRDAQPACVITDSFTTIKISNLENDKTINPQSDEVNNSGSCQRSTYGLADHVLDISTWVVKSLKQEHETSDENGDAERQVQDNVDNIACVLYTSGSTGNPKGVQLTMENLMNRLHWQWEELPYKPKEICLMSKSLTFVDSVTELFGPLLAGVPVVVVKEAYINPELIINYVNQYSITRLVLVPTLLKLLLLYLNTSKDSIRILQRYVQVWVTSGESLAGWLINDFFAMFPGSRFVNLYGSTEVTGDVTYYLVEEINWQAGIKVPIGRPVSNTVLMVLRTGKGKSVTCARENEAGEIAILGKNVCRGYLKGELSTGERFSFVPLSSLVVEDEGKREQLRDFVQTVYGEKYLKIKEEQKLTSDGTIPSPIDNDVTPTDEISNECNENLMNTNTELKCQNTNGSLTPSNYSENFMPSTTQIQIPKLNLSKAAQTNSSLSPSSHEKGTSTPFVPSKNPCSETDTSEVLVYRTGDMGRVVGGRVLFEGRQDTQVKVRGVRVQLAEIEDAVQRSGYTESRCVLAAKESGCEDGDPVLVAFVVLKHEFEDRDTSITEELVRCLRTFLVSVMVPRVVVMDSIPHLPSGKVDRQRLLKVFESRMAHRSSKDNILILRKEEPLECRVLRIMCGALGLETSADVMTKNFFNLGGTSIAAVSVVVRLRELGLDVTLDSFLKATTIGEVVNGILKAKTMAEVMNLFTSPGPPSSAPKATEDEGVWDDEDDDPLSGLCIPQLHPDLPVCTSARLGPRKKGIRLSHLHTLPLSQGIEKQQVIEMLAESFTTKNPLDVAMGVPKAAHRSLLQALWPRLVRDDLSFVVQDPHSGLLGVVINTDFLNEPEVRAPSSMREILALHEPLEEEGRHLLLQQQQQSQQQQQEGKSRSVSWVHNLFLATHQSLSAQDNVRLVLHLERELLRMAQRKRCKGVFTVNSNPLNQLLCEHYLGYHRRGSSRVAAFTYKGRQPFAHLPQDLLLVAMAKNL